MSEEESAPLNEEGTSENAPGSSSSSSGDIANNVVLPENVTAAAAFNNGDIVNSENNSTAIGATGVGRVHINLNSNNIINNNNNRSSSFNSSGSGATTGENNSQRVISDRLAAALAQATRDGVATAITDAIRNARAGSENIRGTSAGAAVPPADPGMTDDTTFPRMPANNNHNNGPHVGVSSAASTSNTNTNTAANASTTNHTQRHIHHQQQQRGRPHVSVERNAQGARVARVNIGRRNVVTLPLNRNENSGFVRVVQLEPLVPTPINDPNTNRTTTNETDEEDTSLQKYKCQICYEFMKEPVGCGKSNCSGRYCRHCLQRVMAEATIRPTTTTTNNNSSNVPKCPTCRVEFTSTVTDETLKTEICNGPTVLCHFNGCDMQLKLSEVGDHEKVCNHATMKCRYASFGCTWVGKRGQIANHETNDCNLAKISGFVEQYRQVVLGDHTSRLDIATQQVSGSIRMNHIHRQNLQRDQLKSTSNVIDLMQYTYVITCTTPLFLFTKDKWVSLFRSNESRAAVINFLVFVPTIITCISTGYHGFGILFKHNLLDHQQGYSTTTSSTNNNDSSQQQTTTTITITAATLLLWEEALICICVGVLGSLVLVGNLVDSKSSMKWGRFAIPHLDKPPIVCDLLAVAFFTIQLSIMEYHGGDIKSFLLWWYLAVSSTFFPALVATISHNAARPMISSSVVPDGTNLFAMSRSLEPITFGLRYSVLAVFVGMAPCLDAPLLVSLIPKRVLTKLSKHLPMKNCFFEAVPNKFVWAYIGIKASKICADNSMEENYEEIPIEFLWWFVESTLAVITLIAVTIFLGCLLELGCRTGQRITRQAQAFVRPEGCLKDYNLLGMVCYGGWMCLVGLLTQFQ